MGHTGGVGYVYTQNDRYGVLKSVNHNEMSTCYTVTPLFY